MISREGPRAAVADVNGDGKEDVYIGGASSHAAKLYIQTANGFKKTNEELFQQVDSFFVQPELTKTLSLKSKTPLIFKSLASRSTSDFLMPEISEILKPK